ncbi:MAG: NYN domain-containing protein, partial [Cyanobacteria bacterium J06632_22]
MKPSSPQAILLVDGYNIVGAWPELMGLRDNESLSAARE